MSFLILHHFLSYDLLAFYHGFLVSIIFKGHHIATDYESCDAVILLVMLRVCQSCCFSSQRDYLMCGSWG